MQIRREALRPRIRRASGKGDIVVCRRHVRISPSRWLGGTGLMALALGGGGGGQRLLRGRDRLGMKAKQGAGGDSVTN